MEPTNEEIVTRLLSSNEILHVKNNNAFTINPLYNLRKKLKNVKDLPGPYGEKYVFIK